MKEPSMRRLREVQRRKAERLAAEQAGVISLVQAYALGLTRAEVRAAVAARRWCRYGTQSIVTHNGPLTQAARLWAAVLEAGPRAHLDGESSLIASGLTNYESRTIRVSVPRGARARRGAGLNVRETRRWSAADLAASGIPRTRPAVAAIRAALWARSDKQAALLLAMTVQQGLATPEQLGTEMLRVRRDRRRLLVHDVLLDLLGGARSLGEIDFARKCRDRGLPEPSRQVVRRGRNGRYYLDVSWEEWRVVVEIDGIHHQWATSTVDEALRQNTVTLQDACVLRLPLLGLRVAADDFFAQIEQALRDGGCPLERSA